MATLCDLCDNLRHCEAAANGTAPQDCDDFYRAGSWPNDEGKECPFAPWVFGTYSRDDWRKDVKAVDDFECRLDKCAMWDRVMGQCGLYSIACMLGRIGAYGIGQRGV